MAKKCRSVAVTGGHGAPTPAHLPRPIFHEVRATSCTTQEINMPIIEPSPADTQDPVVAPLFAYFSDMAPAIPNLFLTLARAPHIFKGWSEFAWPMRKDSTSPRYIRELAIIRVLQITKADNEFVYHAGMSLRAGLKQTQVDALDKWRTASVFSPRERAVLAVAEEIAIGPAASESCMRELKNHFSDSEVLEITMTSCFYVLVARFIFSMGIEHDDPAVISAIVARI
jgi:alkylhydroperoxidase family enzyme